MPGSADALTILGGYGGEGTPPPVAAAPVADDPMAAKMGMIDQALAGKLPKAPVTPSTGMLDRLTGANGTPRYQTWPERLVRGVLESGRDAATLPHDVMQQPRPKTPGMLSEEDLVGPESVGRTMNAAALVSPTNLAGVPRSVPVKAPVAEATATPSTKELFEAAKGPTGYPAAATGPTFHPEMMGTLVSHIEDKMKEGGSRDYVAPKTFRAIQELKNENSVEGMQKVRSLIGGIGERGDREERYAGGMAKEAIDDFLKRNTPEQAEILDRANANFAAASRSKKIETALDVAGLRTGRAGYGGNAVNAARQVLSPFVEKALKGNKQGFSSDEIQAMRDIVEGTKATNRLRQAAMFAPEKGGVSLGVGMEIGHAVAGVPGMAALPILGRAANKLADKMTEGQINRLSELVRKRSPAYAEAVTASANKYADAMDKFVASPDRPNFIKFVVASRSLAAGMQRDGIGLSSGDLIKQFHSPVPAAAEDEQQ